MPLHPGLRGPAAQGVWGKKLAGEYRRSAEGLAARRSGMVPCAGRKNIHIKNSQRERKHAGCFSLSKTPKLAAHARKQRYAGLR